MKRKKKEKEVFYQPIPEKLVSEGFIPDDIVVPYITSKPQKSRKNSKKKHQTH